MVLERQRSDLFWVNRNRCSIFVINLTIWITDADGSNLMPRGAGEGIALEKRA